MSQQEVPSLVGNDEQYFVGLGCGGDESYGGYDNVVDKMEQHSSGYDEQCPMSLCVRLSHFRKLIHQPPKS